MTVAIVCLFLILLFGDDDLADSLRGILGFLALLFVLLLIFNL